MKSEFWHKRWENKEIGFHKDAPNTYLTQYWAQLNADKISPVFVPLCGKSLDMRWLASQGHTIIGVEISEIAIREFFESAGLSPEIKRENDFLTFQAENFIIHCGDLFSLNISHLKNVRSVYDRGSIVALPPDMREEYVAHLQKTLPRSIEGLMICMEYDQYEMDGPPFSVPQTEILRLFRDFETVTDLDTEEIEFRNQVVKMRIWKYTT